MSVRVDSTDLRERAREHQHSRELASEENIQVYCRKERIRVLFRVQYKCICYKSKSFQLNSQFINTNKTSAFTVMHKQQRPLYLCKTEICQITKLNLNFKTKPNQSNK